MKTPMNATAGARYRKAVQDRSRIAPALRRREGRSPLPPPRRPSPRRLASGVTEEGQVDVLGRDAFADVREGLGRVAALHDGLLRLPGEELRSEERRVG